MTKKGAFLAASAFGFLASLAPQAMAAGPKEGGDKVMCEGVNGCKGKGACAGAKNGCAGQNACKGQGRISTSKEDCTAKGGKVVADAKKDDGKKAPDKK
jgi:hypothetical protein